MKLIKINVRLKNRKDIPVTHYSLRGYIGKLIKDNGLYFGDRAWIPLHMINCVWVAKAEEDKSKDAEKAKGANPLSPL